MSIKFNPCQFYEHTLVAIVIIILQVRIPDYSMFDYDTSHKDKTSRSQLCFTQATYSFKFYQVLTDICHLPSKIHSNTD